MLYSFHAVADWDSTLRLAILSIDRIVCRRSRIVGSSFLFNANSFGKFMEVNDNMFHITGSMHLVYRPDWRSSAEFTHSCVRNATYHCSLLCYVRLILDLHSALFDWKAHSWRVSIDNYYYWKHVWFKASLVNFRFFHPKIPFLTNFFVLFPWHRWPWKTTAIFACLATFLFFICGVFLLKDWVDTKERNYWPPNTTR